jgi:peptidyl-prolyl cis-trans isomerase D
MLNAMRQGAKTGIVKFFLFGLLVLAVGGMIFMDVGGFFRNGVSNNSVARVGREQMSAAAFDSTVRRVLNSQNLEAAQAYQFGLIDRIMHSEISSMLITRAAYDSGIFIGDQEIAEQINRIVSPMVSDGMTKKEVLRRVLMNQGMSEGQFVHALRQEMSANVLRTALQTGTGFTPPQEARDLYQYQNEQRTVKTVFFPNSSAKDYKEPTDEVLLPFYQAGQERYAIPETRSFSIMVLTDDVLKDTLDVSDEELQKIYDSNIAEYTQPETRTMEQAVFKDQKTAQEAADKVKSGKSLKESAGSETWLGQEKFQKDGLAKPIADAAFAAAEGDTVGPVQTALGWHVLVVKDIAESKVKPFADVKADIRKTVLHDKLADHLYEISTQIDDRIAGGESFEDVARSMNLKIQSFGPLRADGSTPDSKEGIKGFDKDRQRLLETAFELNEGETAPVIELADGGFATLRVDSVNPKSYKPFDEVKKELKATWIADQQAVLNNQRVTGVLRALNNNEVTLEQVAKEHGTAIKTYNLVRNQDPPADFGPPAKTKFFATGKGEYTGVTAKDGLIVGQVTSITLPDPSKVAEKDLEKTVATATQGTKDEFLMMFMKDMERRHKVVVNDKLLQTMYGPGSEGK